MHAINHPKPPKKHTNPWVGGTKTSESVGKSAEVVRLDEENKVYPASHRGLTAPHGLQRGEHLENTPTGARGPQRPREVRGKGPREGPTRPTLLCVSGTHPDEHVHMWVCPKTRPGCKVMPLAGCSVLPGLGPSRLCGAPRPIQWPNEAIQEPSCSSRPKEQECRGLKGSWCLLDPPHSRLVGPLPSEHLACTPCKPPWLAWDVPMPKTWGIQATTSP